MLFSLLGKLENGKIIYLCIPFQSTEIGENGENGKIVRRYAINKGLKGDHGPAINQNLNTEEVNVME